MGTVTIDDLEKTEELINLLDSEGYKVYSVETNNYGELTSIDLTVSIQE